MQLPFALARGFAIGAARAVVQLVAVGYGLAFLIATRRWYLVIAALFAMLVAATITATARQRAGQRRDCLTSDGAREEIAVGARRCRVAGGDGLMHVLPHGTCCGWRHHIAGATLMSSSAQQHVHGPSCGHRALQHDGHTDYLSHGRLEHQEGGRIHDHTIAVSATNPSNCTPGFGDGHAADHKHGAGCGHETIPHGNHTDYLVNGHLHHAHGDHCDNHGRVAVS